MSFVSIKKNVPAPNSYFMAYNAKTGEMFMNYWWLNEYNNFYMSDEKWTHWGPIWGDIETPHQKMERWKSELNKLKNELNKLEK